MKKAYSHFAALALAALAFSSCSRTDYATKQTTSPLTEATVAQAPAAAPSPAAADLSATVVAQQPAAAVAPEATAPAVAIATPTAAPVAAAPVAARRAAPAPAQMAVAATAAPAAKAAKPTLVQRLALNKVVKQFSKIEKRQQNTASTEQTAARSGSVTILLVGLIALLLGIIISANWLTTIGGILIVVGIILLLLKAL